MTDFAELLYRYLPGIYRQKDEKQELERFLRVMALPLAELEESVGRLNDDFFLGDARDELVAFIGNLVGVEVDRVLPAGAQRTEIEEAFPFYRSKGLKDALRNRVIAFTGWATATVDFSQTVSLVPFVDAMNPVLRQKNRPVGEAGAGTGRFTFRPGGALAPLYDARLGRPITRADVTNRPAELLGVEPGFSIKLLGVEIFTQAQPPYRAVAADLGDFLNPKTPGGAVLTLAPGDVGVDPALGRFLMAAPAPLAANLLVDFSELVPESIPAQTLDVRDSARMARFDRSDDLTPRTLDLRAPSHVSDRIGRAHFDNHGLFLTLGRVVANQRPNRLGTFTPARLTFDSRPLAPGDLAGNALQLMDGLDGAALTRHELDGKGADFGGTFRGFDIRVRGVSIFDPAFSPKVDLRAANLSNFASPTDPAGGALAVSGARVAVDPQLGRVLLDPAGLGVAVEDLRVGYLLAPAARATMSKPLSLAAGPPGAYSFAPDGALAPLRDAYDGTVLSVKLRLGGTLPTYHGTDRGYRLYRDGVDVTGALTPQRVALDDVTTVAAPGVFAVDLDRGRFSLPAGFVAPGAALAVSFSFEDRAAAGRVVEGLAQRLPRMAPAGVVPVIVDTRQTPIDPAVLV